MGRAQTPARCRRRVMTAGPPPPYPSAMFTTAFISTIAMLSIAAPPPGFTTAEYDHEGTVYQYAVYVPADLPKDEPAPAILFLHGYGECGEDGEKQLTVGLPPAIVAEPERWPFVVVVPQKPTHMSEWEDHAGAVFAILDLTIKEQNGDPARVAITGLSQGGHGTIALVALAPERFVAAAPVCAYVDRWIDEKGEAKKEGPVNSGEEIVAETAEALDGTPMWLFHGGKDDVVPPYESQRLHDALGTIDSEAMITIFEDDNHNSWDSAYRESKLAEWLVEQTTAEN